MLRWCVPGQIEQVNVQRYRQVPRTPRVAFQSVGLCLWPSGRVKYVATGDAIHSVPNLDFAALR